MTDSDSEPELQNETSPIRLPLCTAGSDLKFNSPEDLREWLNIEQDSWQWMRSISDAAYNPITSLIYDTILHTVFTHVDHLISVWEQDTAELPQNLSETNEFFSCVTIPFAQTPLGKHILHISEESQLTAVYMLYLAATPPDGVVSTTLGNTYKTRYQQISPIGKTNTKHHLLLVSSEAYRFKASRQLLNFDMYGDDSSKQSLKDSLSTRIAEVTEARNKADSLLVEFEEWKDSQKRMLDQYASETNERYTQFGRKIFRKTIRKTRNVTEKAEGAAKKALQSLKASEEAFKSQVEFAETVGYWAKKEDQHRISKNRWFAALCISVLIILTLPILVAFTPEDWLGDQKTELVFGAFHPVKMLLTVLSVSIGSYVIRFCSRQYSSQQHLYLEAIERQTMLKTYIGLMLNGKLNEQEDRKSALDTLFRPAQTGVVADHGAVMPSDTVIKVIDKQVKASKTG